MTKGPNLAPLLATTSGNTGPSSSSGYQGSFLLRPCVALCCGVGVLLVTAGFFYWEIAALEHAIAVFPPAFLLLPLSGIGALAVLLPMFVFLCFRVSLFCCLLLWLPPTPKPNLTDRRNQPNSFSSPPPAPPLISLPRATLKTPTYSSRRTTRTCFAGPTRAWHKTTERSRRRRCEGRKGIGAGGERESKGPSSPHLPSSCVVQSSAMSYIFWETVIRTHWCYCPSPPAWRSAILSFNASLRLGNFCSYS